MKPERAALAQYRMSRARQTFQDGTLLLGKGSFNGAMNRFYYAAFYAARSLLATKGLDSPKHSGVISLFGQHIVKRRVMSPEIAKVLHRSFEKRLDTDYEDFASLTRGEVEQIRYEVQQFVDTCEQTLKLLVGAQKPSVSGASARRRRSGDG